MTEYLDHNKKKIRKGFYKRHYFGFDQIYYFNGNYNKKGNPLVEKDSENKIRFCCLEFASDLIRLSKKDLEERIFRGKWIEEKLKE